MEKETYLDSFFRFVVVFPVTEKFIPWIQNTILQKIWTLK